MQQIKIFKGIENDLSTLEADINAWLVESDVDVINIFGNIAPQSGATSNPAVLLVWIIPRRTCCWSCIIARRVASAVRSP